MNLENHIDVEHEIHETFNCDQCDKTFVTQWRLRMHTRIHSDTIQKTCHYFNNCKSCPFEKLGCKFLHNLSGKCKYDRRCTSRLCSYQHSKSKDKVDDANEVDIDGNEKHDDSSVNETESTKSKLCTSNSDSFFTSTPKKRKFECEECIISGSQCIDCYVEQMTLKKRVHFEEVELLDE